MKTKKYHHGDLKNALIRAGVETLTREGLGGLSLRKVALRAGVSHSAPYAHFPDKQSLIAAISTEGFNQLYLELEAAILPHSKDPKKQLIEGARAYARFAVKNKDTFTVMFSRVLEKEKEYPAYVEISQKTFKWISAVIERCQDLGVLRAGPPDLAAVIIWGQVHGIISLSLEGQIPRAVLDHTNVEELAAQAVRHHIVS